MMNKYAWRSLAGVLMILTPFVMFLVLDAIRSGVMGVVANLMVMVGSFGIVTCGCRLINPPKQEKPSGEPMYTTVDYYVISTRFDPVHVESKAEALVLAEQKNGTAVTYYTEIHKITGVE